MQQTLLFIPHFLLAGPLLIGWVILCALGLAWLLYRHGWTAETINYLPVIGLGTVVIWLVLPQLEVYGVNPQDPAGPFVKIGLAIRGYGVCLLLAIIAGVGITLQRCRLVGITADQIFSLAFWMTVSGIFGARCLYVIQKSDEFFAGRQSLSQTIISVVDMTKGGLVVYGSLIGGMIAALVFFRLTKLSFLKTADLIAPGMVLGLAIGRIGCLMNGCCYGGVCDVDGLPSLKFPAGSPPYMQQLAYGDLLGLKTISRTEAQERPLELSNNAELKTEKKFLTETETDSQFDRVVTSVNKASLAANLGIVVGDQLTIYAPDSLRLAHFKQHPNDWHDGQSLAIYVESLRQGEMMVPLSEVSGRSLPVHPTQVYASINAFLLCTLLWFYWPLRKRDGVVFASMLVLYSIARFLLEIIRRDESGLLGTELTISQWVSAFTVVIGLVLFGLARPSESAGISERVEV